MSKKAVAAILLAPLLGMGACGATLLIGGAGTAQASTSCPVHSPGSVSPSATPPPSPNASAGRLPQRIGTWHDDQVLNAASVIKAGQSLQLDPWSLTVGVMTAMGESSLHNIDHGDLVGPDSRGLFQQRGNGAWGSLADRMNPQISSTNFFKALLQVPTYHDLPPTIAAHRVQSNADPYYYAPFWPDAVQVVSALTNDPSLLTNLPPTGGDAACAGTPLPGNGIGEQVYNAGLRYLGLPYVFGGGQTAADYGPSLAGGVVSSNPALNGLDCSSFTRLAYWIATGKTYLLPRTSQAQLAQMQRDNRMVPLTDLKAGDLLFFHNAGHVAISDGHGGLLHAPHTGDVIKVVNNWQKDPWFATNFDGAARPPSSPAGAAPVSPPR